MGDPMVPKITIAVRSDAAQGPRRVSPPSNAAAGGVPFPAVARRRFGDRGPLRASLEDTPEVSAPAPRETARHDGSVHATPGCCPVSPLPPGVRGAGPTMSAYGAVHRSGASPGRATRAAWTVSMDAGDLVPGHGSLRAPRMPRTLRASSRGHNGFLFSSLRRCCASGLFAPRHYRISALGGHGPRLIRDFMRQGEVVTGRHSPQSRRRRRPAPHSLHRAVQRPLRALQLGGGTGSAHCEHCRLVSTDVNNTKNPANRTLSGYLNITGSPIVRLGVARNMLVRAMCQGPAGSFHSAWRNCDDRPKDEPLKHGRGRP